MAGPTARMLTLLSLLQVQRGWSGATLAERLQVSDRTLRRDVERLREMGYRIDALKGPDGGYRLEAGTQMPPLLFDDAQVVAATIALQSAAASGVAVSEDALRALASLRQVIPSRLRYRVDTLSVTRAEPPGTPAAASQVAPSVLLALNDALRAREVVRADYRSSRADPDSEPTRHRIEPHHLLVRGHRWYLLGWDLDTEEWHAFRVDRLSPRTPTGPRFSPRHLPGEDPHAWIEARFTGSADGLWPCRGEVVLALPIGEIRPFIGAGFGADEVEELGPRRTRLRAGSWSWMALAASMARFDAPMSQVRPPALARAFAQQARRFTESIDVLP